MTDKRKRGRPFNSFKFEIEGKGVPVQTYKKYISGLKKNKDVAKSFLDSKQIDLSSYRVEQTISNEVDSCLEILNSESLIKINKKEFIEIALRSLIAEIYLGKRIGLA